MAEKNQISGKPVIPPAAESEILAALSVNRKISSDEVVAILKKHGVSGDVDVLQDRYRRRLGQRFLSGIRDEYGQRELLAAGREYVLVECCNDQRQLQQIQRRLQGQMVGLDVSTNKVNSRLRVLDRFSKLFGKAG